MKKIFLILFIITVQFDFYAQTSEEIALEIRSEIIKIRSENEKVEKKVRDPYYKIIITKYGDNLIEYNRVYEQYYHFNNTYLVKNNIITYFHEKGQSANVFSGKANLTASYGDLFDTEYYFLNENKGYKYEKKVPLYRGSNLIESQKKLDELQPTISEINATNYNSIFKFYKIYVKNKI